MTVLVTAPYNEEGRKELENLFGSVAYQSWKEQGRAYREDELIQLLKATNATGLITELDQVTDSVFASVPELSFVGVCRGMPQMWMWQLPQKGAYLFFIHQGGMHKPLPKCLLEM
ncbi:2-hydroxyacid dehydrogenase [Bacillus subtilis]|nr:2-hydroxyacid dehydrogenase [Bacillus subtilis]